MIVTFLLAIGGASGCIRAECHDSDISCDAGLLRGLLSYNVRPLRSVVFGLFNTPPREVYSLNPQSGAITLLGTHTTDFDHMTVNAANGRAYFDGTAGSDFLQLPLSGGATTIAFTDGGVPGITGVALSDDGSQAFYVGSGAGLRRATLPGGTGIVTLAASIPNDGLPAYDSVSNTVYVTHTGGNVIVRVRLSDNVVEPVLTGLNGPTLISVVPSSDRIYATSIADGRLFSFPRGASVTATTIRSGLTAPGGVAIDTTTNSAIVCRADGTTPRIEKIDLGSGALSVLRSFTVDGRSPAFCVGVY